VRCILCDSSERELLIRQREWTVYRCGGCGLGFLDPRPEADELGDLYLYLQKAHCKVPGDHRSDLRTYDPD